jgi:hypothetical protein
MKIPDTLLLEAELTPGSVQLEGLGQLENPMGMKTWSLTSRDKHRLRVFENRVLRRIFGLKRDEVT